MQTKLLFFILLLPFIGFGQCVQIDSVYSTTEVKQFFNRYFTEQLTFPANQIDAVVGFFMKRGFSEQSAKSTGIVLMSQARLENVNIFQLLDTLKNLNSAQLSSVVTQVMNSSREKISILGYKILAVEETAESRNIKP
jgi:hypothetical protein